MSNYKYTISVNPPTEKMAKVIMRAIMDGLKVSQTSWEKNTGRISFEYDDAVEVETQEGDPLMVKRIKTAEAELRAAMEAAAAVGLNVQWVSVGADGRRQILPEPTVIITRTY